MKLENNPEKKALNKFLLIFLKWTYITRENIFSASFQLIIIIVSF
jgi:hypothetical protein